MAQLQKNVQGSISLTVFMPLADFSHLAPGMNPAGDYNIDRSESEMACHYSNSRADMLTAPSIYRLQQLIK